MSAMSVLRSCMVSTTCCVVSFGCAQLALDEHARNHADDAPAGGQRRVGDDAHEPELAAAVDQREARAARAPRPSRRPRRE